MEVTAGRILNYPTVMIYLSGNNDNILIHEEELTLSDKRVPTTGACTICTVMYGNGVKTGMLKIIHRKQWIRLSLCRATARAACAAAAVGTATRRAAVLRAGTAASRIFATATSASASLSSQFNDWISVSVMRAMK